MSTLEDHKTVARDRTEWGKSLSISAPAASRFAEAVAIATAAGAVTLTVMNGRAAHAIEVVSPQQLPSQPDDATQHSAYGSTTLPDSQGQAAAHADGAVSAVQADGNGHSEISHQAIVQSAAIDHQAPANGTATAGSDINAGGFLSAGSQSDANVASFSADALVGRVAEQITSTIGSVLQASQNAAGDGISQALTKDILATAHGIIEDISSSISGVDQIVDQIDNVVSETLSGPAALVGGVETVLGDAFAPDGLVDVLTGSIGYGEASHILPVEGLVAELTGMPFTAAMSGAETASTIVDIPATILGGSEPGKGALADLFYDDGASGHSIPPVSVMVEGQSSQPADVGFVGQTISAADELTGIFHASSSLHLV